MIPFELRGLKDKVVKRFSYSKMQAFRHSPRAVSQFRSASAAGLRFTRGYAEEKKYEHILVSTPKPGVGFSKSYHASLQARSFQSMIKTQISIHQSLTYPSPAQPSQSPQRPLHPINPRSQCGASLLPIVPLHICHCTYWQRPCLRRRRRH